MVKHIINAATHRRCTSCGLCRAQGLRTTFSGVFWRFHGKYNIIL